MNERTSNVAFGSAAAVNQAVTPPINGVAGYWSDLPKPALPNPPPALPLLPAAEDALPEVLPNALPDVLPALLPDVLPRLVPLAAAPPDAPDCPPNSWLP